MNRNERKHQALEVFSRFRQLRPGEYAREVRMIPSRRAWSYLLRLHRHDLLTRGRDRRGRLVYALSKKGAWRLLLVRRGEWPPPPVVRSGA